MGGFHLAFVCQNMTNQKAKACHLKIESQAHALANCDEA